MPKLTLGEVVLGYDADGGSGDPTVLVHGSWVDRRSWGRMRPLLSQGLDVVSYDRRGHGESQGPPRRRPVRDDAEDLAELLRSVDRYPAHVVGHSYGGAVALRLAIDQPELVRSVALHEPPFLGLLDDAEGPLRAAGADVRAAVEAIRAQVHAGDRAGAARQFVTRFSSDPTAWDRIDPDARERFVRYADRWAEEIGDPEATAPSRGALQELDLPVLITTGERSPALFPAIERALAGCLRNATCRTLAGAGHLPQLTDPAVYAGALVTFLLERDVPST